MVPNMEVEIEHEGLTLIVDVDYFPEVIGPLDNEAPRVRINHASVSGTDDEWENLDQIQSLYGDLILECATDQWNEDSANWDGDYEVDPEDCYPDLMNEWDL